MAQPTPYSRLINFLTYAAAHTSAPYNASDHDSELNAIETTLDEILTNLARIQRDDGALKNASVHVDAFTTAALALIAADWTPRGTWLTTTSYAVGDVVQNSTLSYVAATAHTSGTFNTDYTAGKWIILGAEPVTVASSITASAYSHIAATTVQGFLEELTDEKARIAGSTSQTFDVSAATDDTHAVNMGQVQKDDPVHAVAGGSSDAITATLTSGLTTLTNGQRVTIEATTANTTTSPTFELTLGSTSTSAKTIKKGAAGALVAGDIAGAGHKLDLRYYGTGDCWILMNPAYAPGASTAGVEPDTIENFGLAFSVGSSALTITAKTASGGTPTSSDAVRASMRSSSASTATSNTRSITATLSLTVSSGSTLGHSDAVEGVLNHYLIDNSGTLELAVSTKFFGYSGIVTTTAEGGAGAADSATVMYSASARSNVPFIWVGQTRDTQTTAGTWAATPTAVTLVRSPRIPFAAHGETLLGDENETSGVRSQPNYSGFRNRLMNGQFAVAQRGTSFTSATTPANSDDTFLLDRWNLLSDGNDIVDVTQNTATVPTGKRFAIALDVETANKKFGIIQFIEDKNTVGLHGGKVTLSFRARKGGSNSTVGTMRAAVITWDSTADAVTSDVVSAWGVSGTNPTLATNWTYENTPADLTLTTSYQRFKIEGIDVDTASGKNVAVFLFYNNADGTVADFIFITDVQLEPGSVATEFEQLPFGDEVLRCQRYYEKSYNLDVAPGTVTAVGEFRHRIQNAGNFNAGTTQTMHYPLKVAKRTTPTVTIYSPGTGGSGNGRDDQAGGDVAATVIGAGATGFSVELAPGGTATNLNLSFHYAAVAEL